MSILSSNLATLRQLRPEAWQALRHLEDSSFECLPGTEIRFLGRSWPLSAEPPKLAPTVAVLVYGMGDGQWLRQLLAQLPSTTAVRVFDSQPELAWACLDSVDFQELLTDPRLEWWIAPADQLILTLEQVMIQLRDRLGLSWLENPPIAALAGGLNDAFLKVYRDFAQRLAVSPLEGLTAVEQLYRQLEVPMKQAYDHYALSCGQGCAGCCKGGVGFHLSLSPLEWALIHRNLSRLPADERHLIYQRSVTLLARHRDLLQELLQRFDAQAQRISEIGFHLELLQLSQTHAAQEPCAFLGPDERCQIYTGRPLTCRLFGNSHVERQQPYTCDLDYASLERVLLAEGPHNRLVDGQAYRHQLWRLHAHMPYKQVLHLWLLTHLDFVHQDFAPLRLDYQQFQALLRQPASLQARLESLAEAARQIAGADVRN